MMIVSPD